MGAADNHKLQSLTQKLFVNDNEALIRPLNQEQDSVHSPAAEASTQSYLNRGRIP